MKPTTALRGLAMSAALAAGAGAAAQPEPFVHDGTRHRIVVRKRVRAFDEITTRWPVTKRFDYGSFVVLDVEAEARVLLAEPGVELRDDFDLIRLRYGDIDTTGPAPQVPDALVQPPVEAGDDGPRLWLVQFAGPPRTEWLNELTKLEGLRDVGPVPVNARLVFAGAAARARLKTLVEDPFSPYRWHGPYHPAYAVGPGVSTAAGDGPQRVTIELVDHPGVGASLNFIRARGRGRGGPRAAGRYQVFHVDVDAARIVEIALRPDVANVELNPPAAPLRADEVQAQILADELQGNGPSGPGYLAWLATLGFGETLDFAIDVTDTGFDRGSTSDVHDAFRSPGGSSRVAYAVRLSGSIVSTAEAAAEDAGGHGTLNCCIAAGYDDSHQDPLHADAAGFRYGLGVAPHALIGSTRILPWSVLEPDYATAVGRAHEHRALVSSNSWGRRTGTPDDLGSYKQQASTYDGLVRDARAGVAGNQEMVIVFAAGNLGASGIGNFGSTAKNTITVGASENVRPTGDTDGCAFGDLAADHAGQIAEFSSRGPCRDGRIKPDLVAPGTHVQGAASRSTAFDGSSVCGGPGHDPVNAPTASTAYYPRGEPQQTTYTWSSGTSVACPAVAGAAALVIRWVRDIRGLGPPSAALVKAWLMNSAEYLPEVAEGDDLPSPHQGMGCVNLRRAFDDVPRLVIDQTAVLPITGHEFLFTATLAEAEHPVRITLVWTDAPAQAFVQTALVNDLDLVVYAGGETYYGNVFSGAESVPGGSADHVNNVESVYLPAGALAANAELTIVVGGMNIADDGVPGNGDPWDQDFALIGWNLNPVD